MTVPADHGAGIPALHPSKFPEGVLAAFSTRNGDVSGPQFGMNLSFRVGDNESNVRRNREIFFGTFGVQQEELAVPSQVHSGTVKRADAAGAYPETDALITNRDRVFLCVSFADCVPVLLVDPVAHVAAGIHAGWRGTAAGIAAAAVRAMTAEFGASPKNIHACIGPAASACCYAVGEAVAASFRPEFKRMEGGKIFVDLKRDNADQLRSADVPASQIEVMPFCTIMDESLFHSFRRDGERSGRMMAFVGFPGR